MSGVRRGVMLYGHGVEAVAEAMRELDPRYVLIDSGAPKAGQVPVLRFRHAAKVDAAREAAPGVARLAVELYQPGGEVEYARGPLLWPNASKVDPGMAAIDRPELHRAWISLAVATDVLPLLVNACSAACLAAVRRPTPGVFPVCTAAAVISRSPRPEVGSAGRSARGPCAVAWTTGDPLQRLASLGRVVVVGPDSRSPMGRKAV